MDEEPSIKRRLAAILAADIAGYSRLMHEDEAATVQDLKAHQSVILPLIGRHGGQVIDTAGDGIMAEFPSVISATECAVEIQTVMAERNEGVPESRRMRFRIGINLGDVIYDETRIYGDGINIAARLETLAEPGGVLVSHTVYDQVRGKLPFTFEDVGERQVKNIEQPVRMYQLHMPGVSSKAVATLVRRSALTDRRRCIDVMSDAVSALFNRIGRGILVTHSHSGGLGWSAAMKNENIKAIVSFEPGSNFVFPEGEVPDPMPSSFDTLKGIPVPVSDFMALTRIPIIIFYGDNIPDEPSDAPTQDAWRVRLAMAREWRNTVNRHGGDVTVVHLPELGIKGNTHFPFSDLNNVQIADQVSTFLAGKSLD